MTVPASASEAILVVDDEDSVRRTVVEWLQSAQLGATILAAADAESALRLANEHVIDLAILDWHLGAGDNGLQLLQDLYEFNPSVIAIMITAYANQATPLDAMRMGVRDYLDKNQGLTRASFLEAVHKQLGYIRPAKRERLLHQNLMAFRESVEKILPLVQSLAALNDPVNLPETVASLFRFLQQATHAKDGVLFVRHYDPRSQPSESYRVYGADGAPREGKLLPFANSIAAMAVSLQEPCLLNDLPGRSARGEVPLQFFEQGRQALLAAPLALEQGLHVVVELFDKQAADGKLDPQGFRADDQRLVRAAGAFGAEVLKQALAQRQTHQVLFDAIGAALRASEKLTATLTQPGTPQAPPPPEVLEQLRRSLDQTPGQQLPSEESLRLAEAIRVLAVRHGTPALRHCIQLVENLRLLLDAVSGA